MKNKADKIQKDADATLLQLQLQAAAPDNYCTGRRVAYVVHTNNSRAAYVILSAHSDVLSEPYLATKLELYGKYRETAADAGLEADYIGEEGGRARSAPPVNGRS